MAEPIQYLDKRGMITLVKEIKKRTTGAYTIRGNGVYADTAYLAKSDKPAAINSAGLWQEIGGTWTKVTEAKAGWVYSIENEFTTDGDFIEGTGHKVGAGTNVVAVLTDPSDPESGLKWDTLSTSVDLKAFQPKTLDDKAVIVNTAYASEAALPTTATEGDAGNGIRNGTCAALTDGTVYVAEVNDTTKAVTWTKIGDQVTVEGTLKTLSRLIGKISVPSDAPTPAPDPEHPVTPEPDIPAVIPTVPITDEEIIAAFEEE